MKTFIRILHLEDNPLDAAMTLDLLEADGLTCNITLVQTREEFEAALAGGETFDLILSDCNLPAFDGILALELARKAQPAVPVIMISGSLNEEQLVESLRLGATDYLRKERLVRLVPAVRRALVEAEERERRAVAEKALRESEARFRQLAEHSDEVFWFVTLNPERLTYVSPAVEKIWGLPVARFYEDMRFWVKAIHPDDLPRVRAAYEAALAGHAARFEEEYRVIRPDGTVRWMLDSGTLIRDSDSAILNFGGVARDITERKEAAEQMLRAQRLENLGMLAAGIAHDFNNALAPTLMAGPLLRQYVSDPSGLRLLDTVERCSTRGAALVRQLLSFVRGSSGENQLLQIRHVLEEVLDLAEAAFPQSINIVSNLPADLWPVLGNPTQLHQVFLNLCVNARDAMPQGGELTLTGANRTLDDEAAAGIAAARPGAYCTLSVRDTGTGIPPEVLARIWEPFFTTKKEGQGTGLGLSTVYGILHQHGGFVTVRTSAGHGTTFTIYLPAAESATAVAAGAHGALPPRGAGELILVVDDEQPVRELIASILTNHGYRVETAYDGADAIAVFAQHVADIRLLLTDLQMPMMGGTMLATALRRLKPGLPVIAMSGVGSQNSNMHNEFTKAYLAKPFLAGTLLAIVYRTLEASVSPST